MDSFVPVNHGRRMEEIITELRGGRKIEAIRLWRVLYDVVWNEAKDAVEALSDAFVPSVACSAGIAKFAVFFRAQEHDWDWGRYDAKDEQDAMSEARDMADRQHDVFVVRILAKSVTKREVVAA